MTPFSHDMLASFAASGVLLVHALFVALVVAGGIVVLWWPRFAWVHLPALAWGLWISITHRECPLTPLENTLRTQAGQTGYYEGFIEHYVGLLVYPEGLTVQRQLVLAAMLVAFNAVLYGWALFLNRRGPHSSWGHYRAR